MKKKYMFLTLSLMAAVVIYISVSHDSLAGNSPSKVEMISKSNHDINKMQELGIQLLKPTSIAKHTAEDAASSASAFAPGYAQEAKRIEVEYHLLTSTDYRLFSDSAKLKNPKLEKDGFINEIPCYIVTFKGITKPGPSIKEEPAIVFNEFSVIVDADTNEVLYGFYYR